MRRTSGACWRGSQTAIAEQDSDINNVEVFERDGHFSANRFTIDVSDRVHLARIMRRIRREPEVVKVLRN